MTKKRYIKLMMGKGVPRNKAAKMAESASSKCSYKRLYSESKIYVKIGFKGSEKYKSLIMRAAALAAALKTAIEACRALEANMAVKGE